MRRTRLVLFVLSTIVVLGVGVSALASVPPETMTTVCVNRDNGNLKEPGPAGCDPSSEDTRSLPDAPLDACVHRANGKLRAAAPKPCRSAENPVTIAGEHDMVVCVHKSSRQVGMPGCSKNEHERLVRAHNRPPVAADDSYGTDEDTALHVVDPGVLANDSDPDPGDTLRVASADAQTALGTPVTVAPGGGFSLDPAGRFDHLSVGQTVVDTFGYRAADQRGASDAATVTLRIAGVNDPPVAVDDEGETDEDTAIELSLTLNDDDPDDVTDLRVTTVYQTSTAGVVTVDSNGLVVTYDPNGAYERLPASARALDVFEYDVSDDQGATARGTVRIAIIGVNDPPVAADDDAGTDEDTPILIDVLANDFDPDGDPLGVITLDDSGITGTVAVEAGQVRYTPNHNSLRPGVSAIDTFSYTAADGNGGTDTATVRVQVHGVNDPPEPQDDMAETDENTPIDISVLGNDTDPDAGDSLRVVGADMDPGSQGSASVASSSTVRFDPSGQFGHLGVGDSEVATLTYTVRDDHGGLGTAQVRVTVNGASAPPVGNDDEFNDLVGNTPFALGAAPPSGPGLFHPGSVLDNDTDPDGDTLQAGPPNISTANGGSVTMGSDGTFLYLPPAGFKGTDTFHYDLSDGTSSTTASVALGVSEIVWYVDDAPPGGDGTAWLPLSSPAPLNGAGGAGDLDDQGDHVYLRYNPPGGHPVRLEMEERQKVAGRPHGLHVGGVTLEPGDGSPRPELLGLHLARDNDVQGLRLLGPLTGAGFGTATLGTTSDLRIESSGLALDLQNGIAQAEFDLLSGSGLRAVDVRGLLNAAAGLISGSGLDLAGGDHAFTFGGEVVGNVTVNGHGGDVDLGGPITGAVTITNRPGGVVRFGGPVTAPRVRLENNPLSTITFDDRIVVSDGGFHASASGALAAPAVGSSAIGVGVPAVRIVDTIIGAGGVAFDNVDAGLAGPPPQHGIEVRNTGILGGLSVGGGTIGSSGSDGIVLDRTSGAMLSGLSVSGSGDHGVHALNVNGLQLDNLTISDSGDAVGEAGVRLHEVVGAVAINGTTVSGSYEDNVRATQSTGTATLAVAGSTFGPNPAATGGRGLSFAGTGGAMTLGVTGSTFTGNATGGLLADSGGTLDLTVANSQFSQSHVGLDIGTNGSGATTYDVNANTFTDHTSAALRAGSASASTAAARATGVIRGNTIGGTGPGSGSDMGNGISVDYRGAIAAVVSVLDNAVANTADEGIKLVTRLGSGRLDTSVRRNTVAPPEIPSTSGMRIRSQDATALCLDIDGNNVAGNALAAINLQQRDTSTGRLERYTGSPTDGPMIASFVTGTNNASTAMVSLVTGFANAADGSCATVAR